MSDSFVTPWTVAHQTHLSTGFPRQEYWSALPFLPPGDLSNPRIEPASPALQADSLPTAKPSGKLCTYILSNFPVTGYVHTLGGWLGSWSGLRA